MGNVQESTVSKTFITDTNVGAALKRATKGSEARLVSWAVKDFTSKGDNYASVVTSVEVNYLLDGKEFTVTFITKICPPIAKQVVYDSISHLFMKEARVYSEIIPALNSELTSVGLTPLRMPDYYYCNYESGKEVIHLQDLRPMGFKTSDRTKGLDLPHVTLILEELARLHASSRILEVKDGREDHEVKYRFLQKDCFDLTEDMVNMSARILDGNIAKTIVVLKSYEGYAKAAQWMERLKPNAFDKMMKQLNNDNNKFTVMIHGDCWTNNALFRYDDEGHPIEVMLIDLQLVRRASLAADLSVFFYISLTGPERKNNLELYLDIYYAAFKGVLDARGIPVPFTRSELSEEYETKHLYGILWALVFTPEILSSNEEKNSAWQFSVDQGDVSYITDEQKDAIRLMFENNLEMKSRFLSLFDVIVRGGGRGMEGH